MLDALSKGLFHVLGSSDGLKRLASTYGMRNPSSFARRFIAGETAHEAIEAARGLEARGMLISLDLLGESVASPIEAQKATREYERVIEDIVDAGIERNISLKLTQLGLDIDRATAVDNLRRILDLAGRHDLFVRIDMESSPYVDVTLDIFETLWQLGYRNVGVVLQSALKRSEADVERINRLGGRVRLVKGAYKEPRSIAYASKADVDAAFVRLMRTLLINGAYPAIATHDPSMIAATRDWARRQAITSDRYEFQLLYGVRRDLQQSLANEGYRVRVYIPFGREWFPYFMRRLGERPANIGFVARSIFRERSPG
jgi:proline dehydrogenase